MNHPLQADGVQYLQQQLRSGQINPTRQSELQTGVKNWIMQQEVVLPEAHLSALQTGIIDEVLGFGPLETWLKDPEISEIMINGSNQAYIEKQGRLEKVTVHWSHEDQLLHLINRMVSPVGRRIDKSQPMVDARLPDGSRVNAIIAPLSLQGPVLTIRKFPTEAFTLKHLQASGSINEPMAELLKLLIESKQNILIAGGTGSGKTSTLNACAALIPDTERVITVEDSAEMKINHAHLVSLEARVANVEGQGAISIRDLIRNALRMRPDRIVVGEIRGGEAIDMLQAMNTGHQGSLTTIHANAPLESLYRLETMVLMGDVALPLSAIRPQIKQAVGWVIQQGRLANGERKITQMAQVINDYQTPDYHLKTVVRYDEVAEQFVTENWIPDIVKKRGSKKLQLWCKNS